MHLAFLFSVSEQQERIAWFGCFSDNTIELCAVSETT